MQAKLIPPSVRAYAASCAASGIDPRRTGSWRLELDDMTLSAPIRGVSCIYGVGNLKIASPRGVGVRRLVCENTLTVLSPLPEGTELVADRVVLHQPVRVPISIFARTVISRAPLTPFLGIKLAESISLFHPAGTPPLVPSHLKHIPLFVYDAPRTSLPPEATLTTEKIGFSIWHLIALGLFEKDVINEFLDSLNGVPLDTLRVDISESAMGLNDNFQSAMPKLGLTGLSWEECKEVLAWRTTFELCMQTRRPFLSPYEYDAKLVPPAVSRLIQQTTQRLATL